MSANDLKARYGITIATLRKMHREWLAGNASKSELERTYLKDDKAHGKLFSQLCVKYLGITEASVERRHPMAVENERLRKLLKVHGINADPVADEEEEQSA